MTKRTRLRATRPGLAVAASLVGLGAVLVGCLFPSFDELGAHRAAQDADGAASPSSPPSSATPTPTEAGHDATVTINPAFRNRIPCHSVTCTAPAYCCANMFLGTDSCRSADDDPEVLCADQAAGMARAVRCDGPEDCTTGQVCCFLDQAQSGATCASSCAGAILCHDGTHCPVGQTCSGLLFFEYPVCR